jgi:hypothetical protein
MVIGINQWVAAGCPLVASLLARKSFVDNGRH